MRLHKKTINVVLVLCWKNMEKCYPKYCESSGTKM